MVPPVAPTAAYRFARNGAQMCVLGHRVPKGAFSLGLLTGFWPSGYGFIFRFLPNREGAELYHRGGPLSAGQGDGPVTPPGGEHGVPKLTAPVFWNQGFALPNGGPSGVGELFPGKRMVISMKESDEGDAPVVSAVRDLRGTPLDNVRAHRGDEAAAIVRRLVDEEPSPRKPSVAAFNSFI